MASDGEISCTNDPNFAVIFSFLKVFGKLYGLEILTIAKLQEFIENTEEVLEPLKELHLRLLRRALKSVQSNRWEKSLIKFCHQQSYHQEAWEIERFSYKKASTQVKLKVLKLLLEYQFTCHPKFKNTVNTLCSNELRLDPIGRDKNGCVYWIQVDHEANLCLYKEDQDEETWHLIARNREELQKVITQLKNGEDVTISGTANKINVNSEDSSGNEVNEKKSNSQDVRDENDDEFLSPESESDQEKDNHSEQKIFENKDSVNDLKENVNIVNDSHNVESKESEKEMNASDVTGDQCVEENSDHKQDILDKSTDITKENTEKGSMSEKTEEIQDKETSLEKQTNLKENKSEEEKLNDNVSEAIEEPVMIITGEGNGAECEGCYIYGEEISEPVMFIYGEGWGYDNDTGNPETLEEAHNDDSDADVPAEECNGENSDVSNSDNKIAKNVKLKSLNKRSLKKQCSDNVEVLNSNSKKQCKRVPEKDISSNSNMINSDSDKKETSKDSVHEDAIKSKNKGKVKKKHFLKKSVNDKEKSNSLSETDKCQNGKTSIIEKRKSSLSSEHDELDDADIDKEKSPELNLKQDPLPSKKLRLESTPESEDLSRSKDSDNLDVKNDISNDNIENKDSNIDESITIAISERKKIKAKKGKLKMSKFRNRDKDSSRESDKKQSKPLKRSLLNSTLSDKNKSESQSESEEDEPLSSKKRLKIKPKKIISSTRKKVEAKLMTKSSSESEEETLYSLAGKKSAKKFKKKPKNGKKSKEKEDDNETPVRQSRRIAQMKIKEEADRRHLEEVTLRELKMIHKKKNKDDEDEWKASSSSDSDCKLSLRKKQNKWKECDSTGPDQDSDSDEPLFEPHFEPDLDFNKSDHEFSPESDLESEGQVEPIKRARTLQDLGGAGACAACGSGEQPEWALVCEACEAVHHASCLKPMLFLVPDCAWYCPACQHEKLIKALEEELVKYDKLVAQVEEERERKLLEEPEPEEETQEDKKNTEDKSDDKSAVNSEDDSEDDSEGSGWSSGGAVYRLRARRQLPVAERAREYDRLICSAIKEEFVEPTTSAGNQGRGKDISTIIEAAEEEKMKKEREAIQQGKPVECKKSARKQRRKARKLNSLEVPSEDDETDEDFKDTGLESSSSEISSRGSSSETPSDEHAEVKRIRDSSAEVKRKKKGVFEESSSESADDKEHSKKEKSKKAKKRSKRQYDSAGNAVRARVTYGALEEPDRSPQPRTRQRKINYTEMPNTDSEDEMHKPSGKHMADSSDEFKVEESEASSEESGARSADERRRALSELVARTAVVPLEKLPDDVTRAKTDQLHAHLEAQAAAKPSRGRGGRGGRGARGGRGRGRGAARAGSTPPADDALAKLVGVKIKDFKPDSTPLRPNQVEREKKRQEREAKQAEKEARRMERLQKKEEKEKLKEQKAKEREEKKQAKLALQESKRLKREKPDYGPRPMEPYMPRPEFPGGRPDYPGMRPDYPGMRPGFPDGRPPDYPERFQHNQQPRLQVRAELRGIAGEDRMMRPGPQHLMREGTLSVAGSPQPFKPVAEEPSVITRMPHMINQYRSQMMYPPSGSGYGPRGQGVMYQLHPGLGPQPRPPYPQYYYPPASPHGPPASSPHAHLQPQLRPNPSHLPPAYRPPGPHPASFPLRPSRPDSQGSSGSFPPGMSPASGMYGPASSPHGPVHQSPHGNIPAAVGPGPPPSPHGPPAASPHGPSPSPHAHQLPSPHAASAHPAPSPHGPSPGVPPSIRPSIPANPPNSIRPPGDVNASPNSRSSSTPDFPVKIKAEVKTEPEYQSPPASPSQRPASPELPRNRIKHTENKARPLGPYAPQYGPYGPYAPPASQPEALQARLQPGPLHRMPLPPYIHPDSRASPSRSPLPGPERMPYDSLRTDRPVIPQDVTRPPSRGFHDVLRPPGPDKYMMRPMMPDVNRPAHSEGSILHDMIRAPIRPVNDMSRPPLDRPPISMSDGRLPTPERQMQSLPRPPNPDRSIPHDIRYHDMSRQPGPERHMPDALRQPGPERLGHEIQHHRPDRPMHDMMRPLRPERPMHDMLRPPGADRMHDMLRPLGAERAPHDMLRPGIERMHEMLRPPPPDKMTEMQRYPERVVHDMSSPHPDAGRLMSHELPPHYPYMRPQMRAPFDVSVRHPGPPRAAQIMTPYAHYTDRQEPQGPRESVLIRKPSPKLNDNAPERCESPREEEPPSSPPEMKPIVPPMVENVNKDSLKLSNIKVEQPSDVREGEIVSDGRPRDEVPSGMRLVEPQAAVPPGPEGPAEGPGAPREEGSVFGGLVSYFSSQREDDIEP